MLDMSSADATMRCMATFRRADWYESPHYYDILLAPDSEREAGFLEAVAARHGRTLGRNVLEPACGSGRLLLEMARRGWRVTGVDLLRHIRETNRDTQR